MQIINHWTRLNFLHLKYINGRIIMKIEEIMDTESLVGEDEDYEMEDNDIIKHVEDILSNILSSIAIENNIETEFTIRALFSNKSEEIIHFLGGRLNKKDALQWAICYYRKILPYKNCIFCKKKAINLYKNLRLPYIKPEEDQEEIMEEIQQGFIDFENSNDDRDFYKVLI